jgi:hypothetical protein
MGPISPVDSNYFVSKHSEFEKKVDDLEGGLKPLTERLIELNKDTNLSENKFMKLACDWSLIDSQLIGLKGTKNPPTEQTERIKTIEKIFSFAVAGLSDDITTFSSLIKEAENSRSTAKDKNDDRDSVRSSSSDESLQSLYGREHIVPRLDPGRQRWLQSGHIDAAMSRLEENFPDFKAFTANSCDHDSIMYNSILSVNLERLQIAGGVESDPLGGVNTRQIAFPINLGRGHWVMAMADTETQTINYYNSFGSEIDDRVKPRLQQLKNFMKLRQIILRSDDAEWSIKSIEGARQEDGWSCGDHSIAFSEQYLNERDTGEAISSDRLNVEESRTELREEMKSHFHLSGSGTLIRNSE